MSISRTQGSAHTRSDAQKHVDKRLAARAGHVAVGAEQSRRARAVDEVPGETHVEGRQAHRVVAQQFDGDATRAEADRRAEGRVRRDADHELAAVPAGHHRLHQHAPDHLGFRLADRDHREDVVELAADGLRVADVQAHAVHAADLCVMSSERILRTTG